MVIRSYQPWKNNDLYSPGSRDPYVALGAGVVLQATLEAIEGDSDALIWLLSREAELFFDSLDLDQARYFDRVSWRALEKFCRRKNLSEILGDIYHGR